MAELHNEEGQFDNYWVTAYLAEHPKSTGKEAVGAFREMLTTYNTPEKVIPPAPNIPAGNGSVFMEQVDRAKLQNRDTRLELIEKALERAKT
jgi:hypothetical protein